jgi:hypothetical protein
VLERVEAAEHDGQRPQLEPVRAARRPHAQALDVLEQARQQALLERLELLGIAEEAGVRHGDGAAEAIAGREVAAQARGELGGRGHALGGQRAVDAVGDVLRAERLQRQAARGRELGRHRGRAPLPPRCGGTVHSRAEGTLRCRGRARAARDRGSGPGG